MSVKLKLVIIHENKIHEEGNLSMDGPSDEKMDAHENHADVSRLKILLYTHNTYQNKGRKREIEIFCVQVCPKHGIETYIYLQLLALFVSTIKA